MALTSTDTRNKRWFDTAYAWLRSPTHASAVLSVYAGALHLYVVPVHLRAWWGYGVFFLAVGLAQMVFGALVLRRHGAWTSVAGIAGNVAVLGVYVLSRTNGVPLGPIHSEHRLERAGVLDLTAAAVELGLIALLVTLLSARAGRVAVNLLLVAGLGLWGLRLAGVLA